ncbi:ABC transporter permease, partial [Mycobacterium sp. ITM-2017-0098]
MPIDELRHLAESLRSVGASAAAADWDDDAALFRAEARARAELDTMSGGADIAAAAADPRWRARAQDCAATSADPNTPTSPDQARANAVVAVGLARAAVAEAVIAVADFRRATSDAAGAPARAAVAASWGRRIRSLGGPVAA